MPEEYLYDCWYVAAFGDEVTRAPLRRIILDEPVVLYRKLDGTPTALSDRCVHRAYPLSLGELEGDNIVCGYHGFTFDACGTCVWVPGQPTVPKSARVPAYPIVESGPFVWIWMGDPADADPQKLPPHPTTTDASWAFVKDKATMKARWALLVDNLMDLSHETFIHGGTIGSPEVAETPLKTETDTPIVRCWRHMENAPVPPFYQGATGLTADDTIDRWQDIEYYVPSFYTLHVRVAKHGAGDEDAYFSKVMYALTPETKRSTHDFWVISRNRNLHQPSWRDQAAIAFQNKVFVEDIVALEALERNLPDDGHWQELSINIDRGGLQWRRIYNQRLGFERQARERKTRAKVAEPKASPA